MNNKFLSIAVDDLLGGIHRVMIRRTRILSVTKQQKGVLVVCRGNTNSYTFNLATVEAAERLYQQIEKELNP